MNATRVRSSLWTDLYVSTSEDGTAAVLIQTNDGNGDGIPENSITEAIAQLQSYLEALSYLDSFLNRVPDTHDLRVFINGRLLLSAEFKLMFKRQ